MKSKRLALPTRGHRVKPKPIDLPTSWSPQQATAVFELLDELRDRVLSHYAVEIREFLREECVSTTPFMHTDTTGGDAPF
jgi:hypothetical protein